MISNQSPELIARVEDALQQLRPFLEADGGNVSLVDITEDYVARLELLGACKSCSMSMMTLKAGIEEAVKRAAPEIKSVEAINLHATTSAIAPADAVVASAAH